MSQYAIILAIFFCYANLSLAAKAESAVREITSLNPNWQFKLGEDTNAFKQQFNAVDWQTVSIPHNWGWEQAQRGENYYRGPSWYRRELEVEKKPGKRYFLRFEAASSVADVYLNGEWLGQHRGGFGAFCFEITTNLSACGTNLLAVRVSNAMEQDVAPLGGDFSIYGGLYRSVSLIEVGQQCFSLTDHASAGVEWFQTSVTTNQAVLDITAQISNDSNSKVPLIFSAKINDAAGKEVAVADQLVTLNTNTTAPYWSHLVLVTPHLWMGRQDPYLYKAVVELRSTNGLVIDSVEQPLGLRFYSIDPEKGFFLNGQPYHLHGVNRHQEMAGKGWAITEADMDRDIDLIKEIGATVVRCCHYQHSDYFYSLCDRAGILVWAEIPQVDIIRDTSEFENTSRNQLLDLIRQNINHPSIFVWSLFNEVGNKNTDTPYRELQDLDNIAHGEDPTRLTIAATCRPNYPQMNKIPDLIGWNIYPGWYGGKKQDYGAELDKRENTSRHGGFCVSEYGAGANTTQHEQNPKQPKSTGNWHPEEWQDEIHETAWAAIKARPFVWGSFVWCMFDFAVAYRHEGGQVGLNDKGLMTRDRQIKKDAFYFYKANWSDEPVLYITSRRETERTNAITDVKVYSNLTEATLRLNGNIIGKMPNNGNGLIVWKNIRLLTGKNEIHVVSYRKDGSEMSDNCVWNYRPAGILIGQILSNKENN